MKHHFQLSTILFNSLRRHYVPALNQKMYQGLKEIAVEKQDKVLIIKFDNQRKKNSVTRFGYKELGQTFRTVAKDESVTLVVVTGVGDFFSAGNDLTQSQVPDREKFFTESNEIFREMISSVVDCPKIVMALVNGPAIGIGATLTALCDVAWCSDTAYFLTPFTKLGIVPEACSSYLYPLIVGRSKATELLLFGEKMSAEEAYRYNFVSKIFKLNELNSVIWPKIREYAELPPESMQVTKKLIRANERENLYKALNAESDELQKRYCSEEHSNAVIKFTTRKDRSKL